MLTNLVKRLSYDPQTGIFRWVEHRNATKIGQEAGCLDNYGYRVIHLGPKRYYAHRLAVFIMTGLMPNGVVDHRDGDRANNSFRNLRITSPQGNAQNRRAYATSTSQHVGVSFEASRGKWASQIGVNGKQIHLGRFDNELAAARAYQSAKAKYHTALSV